MKLPTSILALLMLKFAFHADSAGAWEQITCKLPKNQDQKKHWAVPEYRPVLDPVSIPPGSPQYHAVLAAIESMNLNPSRFRYVFGGMDDGDGVAAGNGESEIWLQDLGDDHSKISAIEKSDADFSPNCLATESDIIINSRYRPERPPAGVNKIVYGNDKAALFQYGGSSSPLRSILMHELGHSAGLQHEGSVLNLMGGSYLLVANGALTQPYIGEDAAAGLIALYGVAKNAREEVSVSHWRYGGKTDGGGGSSFSVHRRTRIFGADNLELAMTCPYTAPDLDGPLISACPEPVYRVAPGQRVKLELTYENAGKTTPLAVEVRYYLSVDDRIDSGDTLLHTAELSFKRDAKPATLTTDIVIPKTVTSGKNYWLGCIVDADNRFEESFETNNATYVGIAVQ
ncbi:MAG: hypothetical protein ACU837_11230 [Gammaproteobacteria bacterium]